MLRKIKELFLLNLPVIATTLVVNIWVVVFIFLISSFFLEGSRTQSLTPFSSWNIWDSPHYLSIAEKGYQTIGEERFYIAFLPLLPTLIDLIHTITGLDFLYSGYLLSSFAAIATSILLYKLVRLDGDKQNAFYSTLFLLIFPTSFFLFIPYTESTFLFLAISSFLLLRKGYFWLALIMAALASATRITGLALIPALLVEVYLLRKTYPITRVRVAASLIIPSIGFIVYLILNQAVYGNFLQFALVQKQNWHTFFSFPLGGLPGSFDSLKWRTGTELYTVGYAQLIAFFAGVIALPFIYKARLSYGVYATLALLIPYFQSFWLSMPRYLLVIFPLFIVLSQLLKRFTLIRYLWIIISFSLMTTAAFIAINYGPVF